MESRVMPFGAVVAAIGASNSTWGTSMTYPELDRVNAERLRRGLPTLTMPQASTALARRPTDDRTSDGSILGSFALDYLVGLQGVPLPSAGGLSGYMMHEGASPSPDHSSDTGSSYSSSDSSSSSGSSDSSSSSSSGC